MWSSVWQISFIDYCIRIPFILRLGDPSGISNSGDMCYTDHHSSLALRSTMENVHKHLVSNSSMLAVLTTNRPVPLFSHLFVVLFTFMSCIFLKKYVGYFALHFFYLLVSIGYVSPVHVFVTGFVKFQVFTIRFSSNFFDLLLTFIMCVQWKSMSHLHKRKQTRYHLERGMNWRFGF